MISWLQSVLLKHFKWLLLIIMAVVIGSFVVYIGPQGQVPGFGPQRAQVGFFGYNLASAPSMRPADLSAALSIRLATGRLDVQTQQIRLQALERIALLAVADELALPRPDDDDASFLEYAREKAAFLDDQGNFDNDLYEEIRLDIQANEIYRSEGVSVVGVLRDDYRIEQARRALVGPGFMLPFEARRQVIDQETRWTVEVATLPYSSFEPELELSEAEVEAYYAENSFRYEVPEQLVANYFHFPSEDFVDRVEEPTELELQAHFETISWRFQTPALLGMEENPPPPVLEDHRAATITDWKRTQARDVALAAADTFAYTLYDEEIVLDSEAYLNVVAASGAEVRNFAPVPRGEAPEGASLSAEDLASVFALPSSRFYSDPLSVRDGAYVIIRREIREPTIPPLAEVRPRVEADLRAELRRDAFDDHGGAIRELLAATAANGESFDNVTGLDDELVTARYESFERFSPPQGFNRALMQYVDRLEPNDVSQMVFIQDNGFFVRLVEKEEPDFTAIEDSLAQAAERTEQLAELYANRSIIDEIIADEIAASGISPSDL